MMRTPYFIIFTVFSYVFINALFILRYFPRAGFDPYIGLLLYVVAVAITLYSIKKSELIRRGGYKTIYFSLVAIAAIFSLILIFKIDLHSLQVDRWHAISVFWQALFSGKYPYASMTFLENPLSPLPFMYVIALPFHLLGDIGYMNVFMLLLIGMALYKVSNDNVSRLYAIVLLLLSPSFWWEIAVRSDLVANFYFVCIFLLVYDKLKVRQALSYPIFAGAMAGMLFLTRVVAIIPLILYFFNYLTQSKRNTSLFVLAIIGACLLMLLPFLLFWDVATVMKHNPFALQAGKAPFVIQFFGLILCFVIATRVKTLYSTMYFSAVLIFFMVTGTLLSELIGHGSWNTILNEFDITHYNIAMPFIIFSIAMLPPKKHVIAGQTNAT